MKKPTCAGTGLVALDVVLNGSPKTPAKFFAGGSCGNVLIILSFLQWDTFPIARLANNLATAKLEDDFETWNISSKLITKTDDGSTPIIIHRILRDKQGNPTHRFEFKDPENGNFLPRYKAVLSKNVDEIVFEQPKVDVFYFDRINRASIELAKDYKKKGALIYFEPSSTGPSDKLWKECLDVSDVIKFSKDRINFYEEKYPSQQAPLEIITLGKNGLKYRFGHNKKAKIWREIPSLHIPDVVDSAGAGDWCSAGIINKISSKGLKNLSQEAIIDILNYGQALGAINCLYEGARGIMYNISLRTLTNMAYSLLQKKPISIRKQKEPIAAINSEHIKVSKLYM